jgi:hypothetical protein
MSKYVKTSINDGVMDIVIARPEKKNALNAEMYQAMIDALTRADREPSVHAVLFSGEGDMFTAGNDMEDFARSAAGKFMPKAVPFMEAIAGVQKPVAAAVHGNAIGIGTTMLLHCDLVYCRQREAHGAVHQARHCTGSGIVTADADADRPSQSLRHVRAGRRAVGRRRGCLRPRQRGVAGKRSAGGGAARVRDVGDGATGRAEGR